jgi:type II secretory pathway pseudopilin PulG
VLGLLAAIAVLALLYGKAHRDVSSRESQAAKLTAEASRAQAEASALAPYTTFAALRQQREQAVSALVDSRFDWAHAFHEFGRVLTGQTSISSLDGEITGTGATPAASSSSTSTSGSGVSSATPPGSVPVFTLSGCATSQSAVAVMLERLRLIDGVSSVNLQNSTKGSAGSGSSAGGHALRPTLLSSSV